MEAEAEGEGVEEEKKPNPLLPRRPRANPRAPTPPKTFNPSMRYNRAQALAATKDVGASSRLPMAQGRQSAGVRLAANGAGWPAAARAVNGGSVQVEAGRRALLRVQSLCNAGSTMT
jgi:hypothetical protein